MQRLIGSLHLYFTGIIVSIYAIFLLKCLLCYDIDQYIYIHTYIHIHTYKSFLKANEILPNHFRRFTCCVNSEAASTRDTLAATIDRIKSVGSHKRFLNISNSQKT